MSTFEMSTTNHDRVTLIGHERLREMAISVACNQCGKALRVKDEWAGKKAKCPQCGNTFLVMAGVGAPVPAAKPGVTAFNPAAAAAARDQRTKAAGKFSVSPTLIWGSIGVAIFLILLGLFLTGPKRVWGQWEAIGDQARYDVIDVVTRGLQCHLSEIGAYNPRKGNTTSPQATEVMFFRPGFVMKMPDDVDFKGASNQGSFKGIYHPKTGEVEADVEVGGMGLAGVGTVRKGAGAIKVTGRVKSGGTTVEVNGKPAKLHYPPVDDDEQ
jgi:hypothetical protein